MHHGGTQHYRLSFSGALLLLVAASCAATCSASPPQPQAGSPKHRADFAGVLRFLTYLLMGTSTFQLVASGVTLLQMPKPRCLCYTVPYSDAAVCFDVPCCSCANIRQLSATLILIWNLLLMCQLATGLEVMFLYPYLGFCALHALAFLVVTVLVRSYRRHALTLGDISDQQQAARRLAMAADGGGGGSTVAAVNGRSLTAVDAAALQRIQTMSAELVLVLQPDYTWYNADGGGSSGSGDSDGGNLRRCSSRVVLAGPTSPRRGSGLEGIEGRGGALTARPGTASHVVTGGSGGGGLAWALRYTRAQPTALDSTTPKTVIMSYPGYGNPEELESAAAVPPLQAAALAEEGRVNGEDVVRISGDDSGGAAAAAAIADRSMAAEASVRRVSSGMLAAAAAVTALWRTRSGTSAAMAFRGAAAAATPSPPAAAVAAASSGSNGGGGRQASCIRSRSVGLPLQQSSTGSTTTLAAASSPSYGRICSTLSKRSSPIMNHYNNHNNHQQQQLQQQQAFQGNSPSRVANHHHNHQQQTQPNLSSPLGCQINHHQQQQQHEHSNGNNNQAQQQQQQLHQHQQLAQQQQQWSTAGYTPTQPTSGGSPHATRPRGGNPTPGSQLPLHNLAENSALPPLPPSNSRPTSSPNLYSPDDPNDPNR